jgi:hypothetical protein
MVGAIRDARCAGTAAANAHAISKATSGAAMLHVSDSATPNRTVVSQVRPELGHREHRERLDQHLGVDAMAIAAAHACC